MVLRWRPVVSALVVFGACLFIRPAGADEIRLKDGKKLYGVIVAYEDNMFKIKTDFGFILVEKDKIAAIIPAEPPKAKRESPSEPKAEPKPEAKKEPTPEPAKTEPAVEPVKEAKPAEAKPANAPAKSAKKAPEPGKKAPAPSPDKAAAQNDGAGTSTGPAVTPAAPPVSPASGANAPAPAAVPVATPVAAPAELPAATAKEPEPPAMREEVQGNTYINHTYGFQLYKAPSWSLLDDARRALPNAVVAMGTSNQSTLMVVGEQKIKEPLEVAAAAVERRLGEAYENYRRLSQRKTTVSGFPAMEYRYRGKEADHDWSGTLVVVARGKDLFTILGVTYATDDLIQIQENVIARSIASLNFSAL